MLPVSADLFKDVSATELGLYLDSVDWKWFGHLKDFWTMTALILWSGETKMELFGVNTRQHLWQKPGSAGTGPLVRREGKMNDSMYTATSWLKTCSRALLTSDGDESLFRSAARL